MQAFVIYRTDDGMIRLAYVTKDAALSAVNDLLIPQYGPVWKVGIFDYRARQWIQKEV